MEKTFTLFLSAPPHTREGPRSWFNLPYRPESPPRTLSPRNAPLAGRPLAPRRVRQLLSAPAEKCPPGPRHPVPFPFPVRDRALTVHLCGNTVHIGFDNDVSVRANPPNPPLPKGGEGGFRPAEGLNEQH